MTTDLLVFVWKRQGSDASWKLVAGPMSTFDGVQMQIDENAKAQADKSGWTFACFPAGGDPNRV